MFLKTFFGLMIRFVISQTAYRILAFDFEVPFFTRIASYRLEVHGRELEQSAEEGRNPHSTPSLG